MSEFVLGLGGVFWRAKDPQGLARWYEMQFGIPADPSTGPWVQKEGMTVVAPFPKDTEYFGGPQALMLNFRVSDLDAFCRELAGAGIKEVKPREAMDGVGRFAWVSDPEGNRIELWEPVG